MKVKKKQKKQIKQKKRMFFMTLVFFGKIFVFFKKNGPKKNGLYNTSCATCATSITNEKISFPAVSQDKNLAVFNNLDQHSM